MAKIKSYPARLKSCPPHVCLHFPRLLALPTSACTSHVCSNQRFFALVKVCPSKHLVSKNRGYSMKIPQQVACQCSYENCSAVATNENQFIQLLDMQAIVY